MNDKKKISSDKSTFDMKVRLAEMLRGGAIIDVVNADQAKIAEEAGAVAVMALEECPADIHSRGDVARMPSPEQIKKIQESVSIPVMIKCRIGHFVEAQMLEALFVDFIDESEKLTTVDEENHIDKHAFRVPFVCAASDLGEALRRIGEGAAMIRTKYIISERNISETVHHLRTIMRQIRRLTTLEQAELMTEAKRLDAPYHLVEQVANSGRLPVPIFAAGGIVTPADAALMLQLGAESAFIGSQIFESDKPEQCAKGIVAAVSNYNDPEALIKIAMGHTEEIQQIQRLLREEMIQQKGW